MVKKALLPLIFLGILGSALAYSEWKRVILPPSTHGKVYICVVPKDTQLPPTSGICALYQPQLNTVLITYSGVGGNQSYVVPISNLSWQPFILQYFAKYYPSRNITYVGEFSIWQIIPYLIREYAYKYTAGEITSQSLVAPLYDPNYNIYYITRFTGNFSVVIYIPPNTEVTIPYIAIDKASTSYPTFKEGPVYLKVDLMNDPPIVEIIEPQPGKVISGAGTVTLKFYAEDPEQYNLKCEVDVNGKTVKIFDSVPSGSTIEYNLTITTIGNNTITVTCWDNKGLPASDATYVTYVTPPSVAIKFPYNKYIWREEKSPILNVKFIVTDRLSNTVMCYLYFNGHQITQESITVNKGSVSKVVSIQFDSIEPYLTPDKETACNEDNQEIKIVCYDEFGLSAEYSVKIHACARGYFDGDKRKDWCIYYFGGEWYGDHCCGDDEGEYKSTDEVPGTAFDPDTCSIVKLTKPQCNDISDCDYWGYHPAWYCTNETWREHRVVTCDIPAGQKIGTCKYVVDKYEDCSTYGAGYFCSYGSCTTVPRAKPYPPSVEIVSPKDWETIEVPITRKYVTIKVRVLNDVSDYVSCWLYYKYKNISDKKYIGMLPANGTISVIRVPVSVDYGEKITYYANVTCYEYYENYTLVGTDAVTFYVEGERKLACYNDTDCGTPGWFCINETHKAYRIFKCIDGECVEYITNITACPSGTICDEGKCIVPPTCTSDADCPADEWVCEKEGEYDFKRYLKDWYCDYKEGVCKYRIVKEEKCADNELCIQGVCVYQPPKQLPVCPGPKWVCYNDTARARVIYIPDNETGKCIEKIDIIEVCPSGYICLDGKCVNPQKPEPNRAPTIQIISVEPKENISVGTKITITFKVLDDNSEEILVKVFVEHSPAKKIFEKYIISGTTATVSYTPEEEGTYTFTIDAYDAYGAESTETITLEVLPAPTKVAPPTGGAPPAAEKKIKKKVKENITAKYPPTAYAIAMPKEAWYGVIALIVLIAIAVAYWLYKKRKGY